MPSVGGHACSLKKAAHAVYKRPHMQSTEGSASSLLEACMQSIEGSTCSIYETVLAVYRRQSMQSIEIIACSL